MRTFSLIWSGIGCFATVAITVLGGVILAGGGNARAAVDGCELAIALSSSVGGMSSTESLNNFVGIVLSPEPVVFSGNRIFSTPFFGYPNASVGDQFVLSGADFSERAYFSHRGTMSVSFSDGDTTATITIVSTAASTTEMQYYPDSRTAYYDFFCFHIVAKKIDSAKVTAHISAEE
jgi:hypothetical protein